MKRTVNSETKDTDTSESLLKNTPNRMSDYEVENSSSVSVTSEKTALQIRAVIDPILQQLAHLLELMRETKSEQSSRCHRKDSLI